MLSYCERACRVRVGGLSNVCLAPRASGFPGGCGLNEVERSCLKVPLPTRSGLRDRSRLRLKSYHARQRSLR